MSQYIEPVKSALVLFPFVALVLTLPYMLFQYRRYGAVLLLRTAIVYSFVLYLMCAYFLVILPLPDVETVSGLTSARVQLIPFREVADLLHNAGVDPACHVVPPGVEPGFLPDRGQCGHVYAAGNLPAVLFRMQPEKDAAVFPFAQSVF